MSIKNGLYLLAQDPALGEGLPEISPEALRDVELEFAVHEVTENGLELHQHLLVDVLPVRVRGRGEGLLLYHLTARKRYVYTAV